MYYTSRDFLSIDKFLPLFDLFVKESVKADVAKQILETFARTQTEPTDNALALSSLLYVAKACLVSFVCYSIGYIVL